VLVDVTCGGAGHTLALLEATRPTTIVALDRDLDAIAWAKHQLHARAAALDVELHIVHAPFSELAQVLDEFGLTRVSAILADLGVSSHQLDQRDRGFSFRGDAPLDMRMDTTRGPTAAEVLAEIGPRDLTRILRDFGDEPDAARIARALVSVRPTTTEALATTTTAAMSAPQRRRLGTRINPATRTFQALRIHVNDELGQLRTLLDCAPERLERGGRFAAISFHSLEDRLVKRRFAALSRPPALPRGLPIQAADAPTAGFALPPNTRKGMTPSEDERAANPRSRRSRLRVLERISAPS
jgi:16S rRNA (cytosine1402-N4)-methyltransferase